MIYMLPCPHSANLYMTAKVVKTLMTQIEMYFLNLISYVIVKFFHTSKPMFVQNVFQVSPHAEIQGTEVSASGSPNAELKGQQNVSALTLTFH